MTCPFCNKSNQSFIPYGQKEEVFEKLKIVGGGYRKNVICPNCNSMDRERLVFFYIKTIHLNLANYKTLHIAPETNIRNYLEKNCKSYICADLYREDVDKKIDLQNILEKSNSFDLIICNHVLEHIEDDLSAMKEIYRVLNTQGIAILQVPFSRLLEKTYEDFSIKDEKSRLHAFGQEDHVRIYAQDYLERLASVGFKVESINWWEEDSILFSNNNEYGFIKDEPLIIAKKDFNE